MERILLIEDDIALSRGITLALAAENREIFSAGTLGEGKEQLTQGEFSKNFSLVILDINLPDGSGFSFLAWLRERSAVLVLILTANDLEIDQVTGLEMGADDYVTKPFSLAVLRARVNGLLRRGQSVSSVLNLPPFQFDFESMLFFREGKAIELSKTEQRLLRLLVEHRGQTMTRERLLDSIWDSGEFVDENALSVVIKRLRSKLLDPPIKTVYGLGYLWEEK